MQLFTINATPVVASKNVADNEGACKKYPLQVAKALQGKFGIDGASIENVMGVWKGETEASFKISLALDNPTLARKVCQYLRDQYNQEAVMLTLPDNTVEFI